MVLTVTNNTNYNLDYFVKVYLVGYIYNTVQNNLNQTRLKLFDNYLNINSREVILLALRNLDITKQAVNSYKISVSKIKTYKDKSLHEWINLITYGDREIKGYPVVLNTFKEVQENIMGIYKRYIRFGKRG